MTTRSMDLEAEPAPQKSAAVRASSEPIIAARDVHKTYAGAGQPVHALRGVTLEVAKGEMVTIMGPSGCGKTTLLNCLSGLETIDQGEIYVEGRSIHDMPDSERTDHRARRMGFIFQFYNLLPVLSSVENVELPLLLGGVGQRESRERSLLALDQVDLRDWANHRPAQLSGGQRQRVTISRALVNDPAIVWGDEPTGDLDSTNANQIMDLLEDLNQRNQQTFVIVTHDENIGRRANRTIHMRDGIIEGETIHRGLGS
ncbi:MAG: ABC transporter ATP-binding protein [Chloroflexi bacterium]|nr:ABC transporter ATP-binding protein [Chloroflexota bacterium]